MRRCLAPIFVLGIMTACASVQDATTPSPLSATQWTLIDYRKSTADAPEEVALNKYKLEFGADGRLLLTLDCNRGTGTWNVAGSETSAGILSVGSVATTSALCADSGLGEQLGRDLTGSVPFTIYDGRLTLKTEATTYTFDSID